MAGGGANGAGPVLVAELTVALDATPGAWDGWDAADDRTRELFAAWVAEPRRGSVRQARADWTAYYAAHGYLRHAVVRSGLSDLGEEAAGEVAESVAVSLAGRLVRLVGHLIN
ncbi:hypothetical protein CC117_27160 [Parafrankia colletiae]|uniref:Uncharacterized protein n=1 Tax=Parafrankia colletiae TaxID=573497 RepID=A0A1S1QCM6_9ACTN|nr:hypothetical protein [Parafrankia colletiae]MCK9903102.1 hypothetical protein [Frankia sp. Cpl3]OHV30965.1 hypothetical protein CC117_27160 [Parafrankia colletiae]